MSYLGGWAGLILTIVALVVILKIWFFIWETNLGGHIKKRLQNSFLHPLGDWYYKQKSGLRNVIKFIFYGIYFVGCLALIIYVNG
jgi:hypothetical protein